MRSLLEEFEVFDQVESCKEMFEICEELDRVGGSKRLLGEM